VIYLEAPDHPPIRGLISSALSARIVDTMSMAMQRNIHQLLDKSLERGHCDIVQDIANPYAGQNILDFYGIPQADRASLTPWIADYKALIEGKIGAPVSTPRRLLQALFSIGNLMNYFRRLIEQRTHAPEDDFLQSLITASEQYAFLQEDDRLINYALLLIIGQETITHTITNGINALLCHREQLQHCLDDPSLFLQAINEILRYDGPIQSLTRFAKEDMVVGGKQIKVGQRIILSVSAANRDPALFHEPQRFDIYRSEKRHLGFGHGIHGCLGTYFARMQVQIALSTIFQRFPALAITDTHLEWILSLSIRGMRQLPVTLT
jgi:cytochrome P450